MNKKIPQLNAGSMADIAFLLLVFFLLVTVIQEEKGILKILPEFQDNIAPVPARNILEIRLNAKGEFLADNEEVTPGELADVVKSFYTNGGVFAPEIASDHLPERKKLKEGLVTTEGSDTATALAAFGDFRIMPSSSIICLSFDHSVPYDHYIEAMNIVDQVTNDFREELCLSKTGKSYRELLDSDPEELMLKKASQVVYPTCLSEFEIE